MFSASGTSTLTLDLNPANNNLQVNNLPIDNFGSGIASDVLLYYQPGNNNTGSINARGIQIRAGKRSGGGSSSGTVTFVTPFSPNYDVCVTVTAYSSTTTTQINVVNINTININGFDFVGNFKDGRDNTDGGGLYNGGFDWIAIGMLF